MRRKRIAALMAGLNRGGYLREFSQGMAETAAELDVDLCIFNAQGYVDAAGAVNEHSENRIYSLPDLSTFDAIVGMISTLGGRDAIESVMDLINQYPDTPRLLVDYRSEGTASLYFDDDPSVVWLMHHLVQEHGLHSFAMVGGPVENPVAEHRINTAMDALRSVGGEIVPDGVQIGSWTRSGGAACARKLIRRGKLPDAVVCMNDDMALGVLDAFTQAGIRVPEDVCITGFDCRMEAVGCGITTIRRPVIGAGRLTVRTLLNWSDGNAPDNMDIHLPTEIIYGSSCGCSIKTTTQKSFAQDMARELYQMDQTMMRASSFSSALFDVKDHAAAGQVITQFAGSWGIREMHVCVHEDFPNLDEPTENRLLRREQMLLLSSSSSGKEHPQTIFPAWQLLPHLDDEDRRQLTLVFNPLYYSGKDFGYAVMDLAFASTLTMYSVLSLLDGALMNLAQKMVIRDYAQRVEDISRQDPLTGLMNRRGYLHYATDLLDNARKQHRHFAMVTVDMNGMKKINDQFGHLAGDQAICRMGEALRALEKVGMTCVHISGDEFLAIGPTDGPESAKQLHDLLISSIHSINDRDPWITDISASIGVFVAIPSEDDRLDDYQRGADRLMYVEKREYHKRLAEQKN